MAAGLLDRMDMDTTAHARSDVCLGGGCENDQRGYFKQARRPHSREGAARAEVALWEIQYGGGFHISRRRLHLDAVRPRKMGSGYVVAT